MKSIECFHVLKNLIHTVQIYPPHMHKETQRLLENSAKRIQQFFKDDEKQIFGLQEELVQQALMSFRKYVEEGGSFREAIPFTSRQLKRVLHGVFQEHEVYLKDHKMIEGLVFCLQRKRNNPLIKLLVNLLFENWDTLLFEYPEVKEQFFTLAEECISSYGGKREFLLFCKANPGLLSTKGPTILGAYLVKSQALTVEEKLWEIGLSSNSLNYQFIEHALINYYLIMFKEKRIDFDALLQETERILLKIDSSVGLIIVSILIKNLENMNLIKKERIISFALRILGDPLTSPRWIYNKREKRFKPYYRIVDDAKNFILEEMNREILTLFFNIIAGDEKRKKFWETYLRKVDHIKIATSAEVKTKLLSRKEIRDKEDLIHARFVQATYGPTAILLYFSNRIIVEFSETGNATYVYKKDNPLIGNILRNNTLLNTTRLKQTHLPTLPKNSLMYNSFKDKDFRVVHHYMYYSMYHIGWEKFYKEWLKDIVGI